MAHHFDMWFDGGARPTNPGNGYGSYEIRGISLYGRFCTRTRGHRIEFGFMSNNVAEYQSLVHGLRRLIKETESGFLSEHHITPSTINLHLKSDSKLLVEQLNGRWKCKKPHIKEQVDIARALLKRFRHWKLTWNSRRVNVGKFGH